MTPAEVPPRFKIAFVPWVVVPVPARAVETVNPTVLLLARNAPVTVTLGIVSTLVPKIVWLFVLNVYTPVPAVKVPLSVMPPRMVAVEFPELFHVPATVTRPVNVFAPVELVMFSVSVTVVGPLLVKTTPPMENIPDTTVVDVAVAATVSDAVVAAVLLMTSVLKFWVVAPMVCALPPEKTITPVLPVNVPAPDQFPCTVVVLDPPFNVPSVITTLPVIEWLRVVPMFSVPPDAFTVRFPGRLSENVSVFVPPPEMVRF